jgi:ribosome biogenesis protein ERB1
MSIDFTFHTTCVRTISVSPCGEYLASGDEDGNLVIWHVKTTRILRKYKLENKIIDCVEWNPIKERSVVAVCNEEKVYVINTGLSQNIHNQATATIIDEAEKLYKQEVVLNDKKE